MSDQEDAVLERLYNLMTTDWTTLQAARRTLRDTQQRLRSQVAQALTLGASGRGISRRTRIPEATVRRWAAPAADSRSRPSPGKGEAR